MSREFLSIDGSMGEGGGQVLRASLALSMALGRPFRMANIRAGRPNPGLKRQHLTCLRAAAEICGALIEGDEINSTEICFAPGEIRPGEYSFDIGGGGSCSLVLQALVPPLLFAGAPSRLKVRGGTHVPHAPVFEFLRETLFPWLEKLGPRLSAVMQRPGFMQIGGGEVDVEIHPAAPRPLKALDCGAFLGSSAEIRLCDLDGSIALREKVGLLEERASCLGLDEENIRIENNLGECEGPGNAIIICLRRESGITVCSAIGQPGISSEVVARKAYKRAVLFLRANVPVEKHLADQLIVPLALAGGGEFLTEKISKHAQTCLSLLPFFMPVEIGMERQSAKGWLISLRKDERP